MSNKNENNFCIICGPGGLLKLDIIVCKVNVKDNKKQVLVQITTFLPLFLTTYKLYPMPNPIINY